jgi:hypothetical protein
MQRGFTKPTESQNLTPAENAVVAVVPRARPEAATYGSMSLDGSETVVLALTIDRLGKMGPDRRSEFHLVEYRRVARCQPSLDDDPIVGRSTVLPSHLYAPGVKVPQADHPGDSRESSSPSVAARVTASEREWTPSLRYSSRVCVLTVFSER